MAMTAARQYISLDTIPEVALERERIRQDAWASVRFREQQLVMGHDTDLPLVIDALSTAEGVLEAGYATQEYEDRLAGLELDCLRLVAEWYRKKRPEYFPPTRHFFDAETGDFYSHGVSTRQMTENALRPLSDNPEEEARRVNEKVENETPHMLRKIGGFALAGAGIRTISECTDKAVADYQQDIQAGAAHRGYDGYVPEIEKVMIRDMRVDADTGDRWEEQVGVPGVLINHFVIQEALRRRGVDTSGMGKTELHGTQLLVEDDLMDFIQVLDEVAAEEWCMARQGKSVFMGEAVPAGFEKNYEAFRKEALARQEGLKDLAKTVATFVLDLAADGFDRRKAPAHVENFVKKLLLQEAQDNQSIAADIFDEKTARGLQEVSHLQALGQNEEAFLLMQEVEKLAPGGGYCSGGSCGLESIYENSAEGKSLREALKAESGDTIVRDKERKCRCGAKDIVYAYNKNKVNKYCGSCQAFESKRTK